jgi:hypothetical protein
VRKPGEDLIVIRIRAMLASGLEPQNPGQRCGRCRSEFLPRQTASLLLACVFLIVLSWTKLFRTERTPSYILDGRTEKKNVSTSPCQERYEDKVPFIACWIVRSDSVEHSRSEATVHSWAKTCNALEYIDSNTTDVYSDWNEGYLGLASKSWRAWQFMLAKHVYGLQQFHRADFILKADLDTYIKGANLRRYLKNFNPDLPYYLGKQLIQKFDNERLPFVAGAAIILSREALIRLSRALAENKPQSKCARKQFLQKTGEDVALGLCLSEIGIYPHDTRDSSGAERFMVFDPHFFTEMTASASYPSWYNASSLNIEVGPRCCSNESISFHRVRLEDMVRDLHLIQGHWRWGKPIEKLCCFGHNNWRRVGVCRNHSQLWVQDVTGLNCNIQFRYATSTCIAVEDCEGHWSEWSICDIKYGGPMAKGYKNRTFKILQRATSRGAPCAHMNGTLQQMRCDLPCNSILDDWGMRGPRGTPNNGIIARNFEEHVADCERCMPSSWVSHLGHTDCLSYVSNEGRLNKLKSMARHNRVAIQ